jgi:hypothetical protein
MVMAVDVAIRSRAGHYSVLHGDQTSSVDAMNAYMNSSDSSVTHLLDVFAKLRKATISFVTSIHLSVRIEQLSS